MLALFAMAAMFGYISLAPEGRSPAAAETATPPPSSIPAVVTASQIEETPVVVPMEGPAPESAATEPAMEPETASATPETEPAAAETVLNGLHRALASIRCADLRAEMVDDALMVAGTVTSADDRDRVLEIISSLPAGAAHPPAVDIASPLLCEPLLLLEPLRTANDARGEPLALAVASGGTALTGGQDLVLDIRVWDIAGHVQVDYFTVDGSVVHLLPNPLEPDVRLAAGTARRLGERDGRTRFWTIGPPFGHELIAVVVSSAPLFPTPRPETEPAADYLPDLKRALAGPAAENAVASALFIATRAP